MTRNRAKTVPTGCTTKALFALLFYIEGPSFKISPKKLAIFFDVGGGIERTRNESAIDELVVSSLL